ncbi:hypothetical protein [Streptomyces chrestomyceticus]|uniref:hypothetical protein n=1 Tax=Streptomyces chrestomyceticus TaxID=68185 RepID=UPI0037A58168
MARQPHHRYDRRAWRDESETPGPGAVPYTYRWSVVPRVSRRAQVPKRSGDAVEKATVVSMR